jgi:Tfp pilus assembly protein FimT
MSNIQQGMSNFKPRHSIFDIPSGFTLIELLVVIAACLSNVAQLGLAWELGYTPGN